MKFSVITPTVQRRSLFRACKSLDVQTFTDWEHIVMVDCPQKQTELISRVQHPKRTFIKCEEVHNDYGNTCRANALEKATGEWVLFLDDDNYISHANALKQMAKVLENVEYWAIFPIIREGEFFQNEPLIGQIDSGNIVARRELVQWPRVKDREADGMLAQELSSYPYQTILDIRPWLIMEKSSWGERE